MVVVYGSFAFQRYQMEVFEHAECATRRRILGRCRKQLCTKELTIAIACLVYAIAVTESKCHRVESVRVYDDETLGCLLRVWTVFSRWMT